MADFYLNYATYCDGELSSVCLGRYTDEEAAMQTLKQLVQEDREDYNESSDDNINYDDFIQKDTDDLFEWDDGQRKEQYSIQEYY